MWAERVSRLPPISSHPHEITARSDMRRHADTRGPFIVAFSLEAQKIMSDSIHGVKLSIIHEGILTPVK